MTITLKAQCLFSKHGFDDGDQLDAVLGTAGYDLERRLNETFQHTVLILVVERFLLPVLPTTVKVQRIATHHNPIRAIGPLPDELKDVEVDVSIEQVLLVAEEVKQMRIYLEHLTTEALEKAARNS